MKKLWFKSFALILGLASSTAFGQYPNGYDNFGPSSYPVNTTSIIQNLPQVPQQYGPQAYVGQPSQYQLVGAQDQVYGGNYAPSVQSVAPPQQAYSAPVPAPTPMAQAHAAPAAGCQSCGPTTSYAQPAASGCNSCGPATAYNGYAPSCGYLAPTRRSILSGMPAQARPWFFGAGALIFNRIDDKNIPLSLADAAYSPDILGTRDARHGTAGGFETTIGRYFNCGRNAIALTYWGVYPSDVEALRSRPTPGDYRSRIPFTYMEMAGTPAAPATPYPVYDWYDNAYTHTLQRSSEYHNVEVNLLGFAMGGAARNFNKATSASLFSRMGGLRGSNCGYCGGAGCGSCSTGCASACTTSCNTCKPSKFATGPCCLTAPACGSRMNVTWLAGLRYFRFNDNLLYAASLDDSVINRAADDLYYEVNTKNDLVGFQIGGRMDFCVGKRINLYANSKVGIYNNRANMWSRLGTDFDYAYLNDTRTPTNPNNGQDYLFNVTQNQVAFLSEMGAGMGYRVSCKWTATMGYRAVIASGVATAPGNVQTSFANYGDIQAFDNCDTLILHGINVGAVYNF